MTAAVDAQAVLQRRRWHRLAEDLLGAGVDLAGVQRPVPSRHHPVARDIEHALLDCRQPVDARGVLLAPVLDKRSLPLLLRPAR